MAQTSTSHHWVRKRSSFTLYVGSNVDGDELTLDGTDQLASDSDGDGLVDGEWSLHSGEMAP